MYIEMILKVATFCICRNIRVGTFWKIPEHSSFWNYNQVHLHSQMQASIISELEEVVEGYPGPDHHQMQKCPYPRVQSLQMREEYPDR